MPLFCTCILQYLFHLFKIEKRREFERRRKLHYNEFEAVMRARELMEQDEDEDDNAVEDIEVDEVPSQQHHE